ncbi:MBOAT family protein [Cellulophaga sp. Hel_I_12]|uniref:MBOAT family O-acyltransferase n=1 Tax=Cellulophaga sp. Hel_I_12 TaxID=1249972 RepID=UPI00350F7E44
MRTKSNLLLFNSIAFLLFLPTVFLLYWFVFDKKLKQQNFLILVSSYVFYGWWDYRFLMLIAISTLVDYLIGLQLSKFNELLKRKALLWISMLFNLGVLGFFKYYNFFIESWLEALHAVGYATENNWTVHIILPIGISFYTFQTMSYTIDVYKKNLEPTKDLIAFASFVSFFPQLVAGPIERATNLLPQIINKRKFSYEQGVQGLRLILWGLFKKVVIADSLAPMVNEIFGNYQHLGSASLWMGAIYFAFQIYCDFSGYSDIAIGTSKLFGFELMSNFKFPYFSRNIAEFWRRWHISLSTWFRDYLYIPLGGSKFGKWVSLRNIFIIFIVSGFWHGANWTFIVWGGIHALLYIPSFIFNSNRKYLSSVVAENSWFPSIKELFQMTSTFIFVTMAWVFFRSDTIAIAYEYVLGMFTRYSDAKVNLNGIIYLVVLLLSEWFLRKNERSFILPKNLYFRYSIYVVLIIVVYSKFFNTENEFIYFQF